MTDIKYHRDATQFITNELRVGGCDGDPIDTGVASNRLLTYTVAERHRRKPRNLLPTQLHFYSSASMTPFDEYECKKWPCGTSFRKGSYNFTHNSQTIAMSKQYYPSKAKQNSMSLLASSGFTSQIANYGESLASLSETGKMIHRRARQVAEIANALRRRNFRHLEKILKAEVPSKVLNSKRGKELSSGWLELEFGWKPLVQDVYSAVDIYRSTIVKNGQLVKSQTFGDRFQKRKSLDLLSDISASSDRVSARAYGIVSNPNAFTLNQLGLLNPALLAWQLLPFSFVVDWFLPISRILGHLTNRIGLSAYVVCVVSESTLGRKWRCDDVWMDVRKQVYRNVSSRLLPDVTTLSPRSLGLWHVGTAASLVAQSFGRHSR